MTYGIDEVVARIEMGVALEQHEEDLIKEELEFAREARPIVAAAEGLVEAQKYSDDLRRVPGQVTVVDGIPTATGPWMRQAQVLIARSMGELKRAVLEKRPDLRGK